MRHLSATYLVLGLLMMVTVACKPTDPAARDRVVLAAQESAKLASGITVFVDAIADYRCPPNANCASGGSASVLLRLHKGQEFPVLRLSLGVRNQQHQGQLFTDSTGVFFDELRYKVVLCDVVRLRADAIPMAVIQVSRQ